MRIAIDLDDTLSNMSDVLLPILNYRQHKAYTKSDIITWTWYTEHFNNPWSPLNERHFWDVVEIDHDGIACINQLAILGHDIKIVTASHFHNLLGYKITKTIEKINSPYITEANIIVAQDKSAINADVRIDDNPCNLIGNSTQILFAQPWNESICGVDLRSNSWENICKFIMDLK